ncbi:hypothetical protein QN408_25405, partial [Pseudomonas sp. CCI4.2]
MCIRDSHYPAQPVDLCCTFSAGVVELCDGADSLMLATLADDALYLSLIHIGVCRVVGEKKKGGGGGGGG